ncbi:hypothetical protein [Yinghuangia soli]|uniref:Uncharacterized protein n=1 Tax=Yinghuangia soli TaxID=2908204 RepID=A0AA41U7T9_9ACTN|nr:hypothetical protein [Yinghuangia soli]MCF2532259.1 hypothetical protein [Yinghuangia soli]
MIIRRIATVCTAATAAVLLASPMANAGDLWEWINREQHVEGGGAKVTDRSQSQISVDEDEDEDADE